MAQSIMLLRFGWWIGNVWLAVTAPHNLLKLVDLLLYNISEPDITEHFLRSSRVNFCELKIL